jgi:hypothetical protein
MPTWVQVGFTYYNDPPPGAGDLRWGGYSFAELGTATRGGVATGVGNLGAAFGLHGEEPMGSVWTLYYNGHTVQARKQDRGYGQGGDGTHSDPRYAIDLYDGSAHGLPNLRGALHAPSSGALWIMRGAWHPPLALPPGVAHLPPVIAPSSSVPARTGNDPPDHSPKVKATGKRMGEVGSSFGGHAQAMRNLAARNITH